MGLVLRRYVISGFSHQALWSVDLAIGDCRAAAISALEQHTSVLIPRWPDLLCIAALSRGSGLGLSVARGCRARSTH